MTREPEVHNCCHDEPSAPQPWYRRPVVIWTLIAAILFGISYLFPAMQHFRHTFKDYIVMMSIPVLLGLLIGGLIDYYIPKEYVAKFLTSHKKRTVFYATGLGFLMSACSHGILALSMELHKKGASGPAVISFLLASPWANLPITFLLVGFFGWRGVIIIAISLFVAMSTGLLFQILDQKNLIEKNRHTTTVSDEFSIGADIAKRFRSYKFSTAQMTQDLRGITVGMISLADMIFVWIIIGMLLASFAAAFVPMNIFHNYFGSSMTGLLCTMAAATIVEVCSEGTAPLAFEIYRQTGALGNAFAFLMGGVVTDYTEIGLVWKNLGPRTALWMIAITLPQVFLFGILLNVILK